MLIQEAAVGFDLKGIWEYFLASLTARNIVFFVLLLAGIVFAVWSSRQNPQSPS